MKRTLLAIANWIFARLPKRWQQWWIDHTTVNGEID